MIETLPWEEISGNPDKYIQLAEERKERLQRDSHKVRQELAYLRKLKEHKETQEQWRASGIPDQRQSAPPREETETPAAGGFQQPTRKMRILRLMSQDPQRQWKALEMAHALDEPAKIKSVRVAMDEQAKAGDLTKLPNAFYQYAPPSHA